MESYSLFVDTFTEEIETLNQKIKESRKILKKYDSTDFFGYLETLSKYLKSVLNQSSSLFKDLHDAKEQIHYMENLYQKKNDNISLYSEELNNLSTKYDSAKEVVKSLNVLN